MNPNLPPKGSTEWYALREALSEAYLLILDDFQTLIVEPMINDDTPSQYRALADFRDWVQEPAERYDFTAATSGLRDFMREYRALRIRFREAFDHIFLPALRMLSLYQDYYDFYGPP